MKKKVTKRPLPPERAPLPPRTPEEAALRADQARRDRALPYTDSKPFSMWKS